MGNALETFCFIFHVYHLLEGLYFSIYWWQKPNIVSYILYMSKLPLLAKAQNTMENIFLLLGYKGSGIKPSLHFPFILSDYRGTSSVNNPRVAEKRKKKHKIIESKAGVDFKKWFLKSNPRIIRRCSLELRNKRRLAKNRNRSNLFLAQSKSVFPHREPYMLLHWAARPFIIIITHLRRCMVAFCQE